MNAEPDTGEGTERPHNHTIDGHHWHDCPGCDDGTPQHEATLRLLELIHDQSPTHEWCKADGGRGIGDAHYHELVEAVTAFLSRLTEPFGDASVTKYDRYACTQCAGTGERRNESQNLADQRAKVLCFCDGKGEVWVLTGYKPPWYAGESLREPHDA